MMFDILDFIDSLDIREYNRDTVFTPAQKAVLIVSSMAAGLENKTEALILKNKNVLRKGWEAIPQAIWGLIDHYVSFCMVLMQSFLLTNQKRKEYSYIMQPDRNVGTRKDKVNVYGVR